MEKDPSPLDTLRQLKEWLDAGTITPDEFQTLKQQLLFAPAPLPVPAEADTPPVPQIPVPELIPPQTPASKMPVPEVLGSQTVAPEVAASPVPAPEATLSDIPPPKPVVADTVATESLAVDAEVPQPPVAKPVTPGPVLAGLPVSPVLPPVTAPVSVVPELLPPVPTPKAEYVSEPTTVAPVEMAPLLPPITHVPAAGRADAEYVEQDAYTPPRKSPLMTIVVVAAVLALLGLVAYLLMDGRDSEHLTSTSRTEADSVAIQPEVGPQTEQIDLPPVAVPETIRVAPVAPPVVTPASAIDTAAVEEAVAVTAAPAAAEAVAVLSESAARARVEGIMQRYYTDLQAAPFTAAAYFAPQVERFYTMQRTTPAAINAELVKTHFPEFLEGQSNIQAGTLQVGAPVADGSRVVTYVEDSKAFRQSRQEIQRTSAQMRVRFDKDFRIVYLRQEKLLKNEFGD